ncbi:hypothetical protein ABBQ32_012803 [Trebouxia sp. C0010 RCD-2024]
MHSCVLRMAYSFSMQAVMRMPERQASHAIISMSPFVSDKHLWCAKQGLNPGPPATCLHCCLESQPLLCRVWFFLAFKEQILGLITASTAAAAPDEHQTNSRVGLNRILTPISGLAGWVIVVAGVLSSAQVMGINVQPLLAVGGVSGIAIGFGAQSVSANAITGINLFVSRPFVVGDRVELRTSSGTSVVTGLVERISPMTTTIRNDLSIPISIPNKAVGDMIVVNESRLGRSSVQENFKDPRLLSYALRLRYSDFNKVDKIISDINAFLDSHPGVDSKLPHKAGLTDLATYSVDISIMVHTTPQQSRKYSAFKSELLAELLRIVDRNGARLAYPTTTMNPPV